MRLAGSPLGAILLLTGCGFVGWAWNEGHLTWWWLVIAAFTSLKTLESIQRVRRYKAWHASWLAMGGQDAPVRPKKRRGLVIASVLAVALPFATQQLRDNAEIPNGMAVADALMWVWAAACLYLACRLVWKLLTLTRRGLGRVAEQRQAKADLAPVSWLLPRASSSPSRAEAEANLPDYCARLIGPPSGR
jgi:hypothetical protein